MHRETATLAGGCFWCTEAIFKRLKGVISILPGYTGGVTENPTYKQVCSGTTGHAEAIQIDYDADQISFETIISIFIATHDPTSKNRQGNDVGPQYRSVIFYHDEKQQQVAEKSLRILETQKVYEKPIVTEIIPFTHFYQAENYHHDYYDRNRNQPYCNFVISPKIHKLIGQYENYIKAEYKKK